MGSTNTAVDLPTRAVGLAEHTLPAQRTAPVPPGPLLSVRGLKASYHEHVVVDDVSFDVRAGEAYGLVGPAGAGKSTTVRMVCGLLTADEGTVMVRRTPIDAIGGRSLRESVSYVPQSVVMIPSATIGETVRFWARFFGLPRAMRRDRAAEVLSAVGLFDRAGERVDRCTGGVLRELSLAVALLHRPRLLVLDQPTTGIDPESKQRLLGTLARLRDEGVAVLYACRDLGEVRWLCDRFGLLHKGTMVAEGSTSSLSTVLS
ncbi:ABC transporter ATP-binding protein [Actinokineospora sp. HUAS TT18]|uniref:ABC transporter ATP-binding protein n=1 Tax=Actinokineospora sp. HUAS TT18 TaxID=3447451 RepID=UPI003F5278D9